MSDNQDPPENPTPESEAPFQGDSLPPLQEPPAKKLSERLGDLQTRVLGRFQELEPMAAVAWASSAFQRQGTGFYFRLITLFLCTYIFSDLAALMLGRYIPEPPTIRSSRPSGTLRRGKTLEDYAVVFSRNLFNSRGLIPGEESGGPLDLGGAPVRTTLPFNLIGTLILHDELRSIATIEDKSASLVYPVRIDDEIPSKAKIVKIEKSKVVFVNTASGRREYIDMPEDPQGNNPRITLGTRGGPSGPTIERVGGNQYNISRLEVDKQLSDLNNILTQARAVPNFENGLPSGYKLFQIVPGSIYDKLGLKNGDVVAGLDGSPINDPGKAFEMLSRLKESNHLELQIKRDGRASTFSYDIR